jgi:uncharacterized membrane protein (UPF0127 family)
MKKYAEFIRSINEDSGKNFLDVYDEDQKHWRAKADFGKIKDPITNKYVDILDPEGNVAKATQLQREPAYEIHKAEIMEELKELLRRRDEGQYKSVTVIADIPTSGERKPAYLADVLPPVKRERTRDDRPEGEEPDDINIYVDVEFEVVELDEENNKIVGIPKSLKRKNITVPIDPQDVIEVSFKRSGPIQKVPLELKKKYFYKKDDEESGKKSRPPGFVMPVQVLIGEEQKNLPKGVKENILVLEPAKSNESGLSGRTKVKWDGMIFRFKKGSPVQMHMKDCLIPLDIVFCSDGVIQKIDENCPPCNTPNCQKYTFEPCDMVIEMPAGEASEKGLYVGEKCIVVSK